MQRQSTLGNAKEIRKKTTKAQGGKCIQSRMHAQARMCREERRRCGREGHPNQRLQWQRFSKALLLLLWWLVLNPPFAWVTGYVETQGGIQWGRRGEPHSSFCLLCPSYCPVQPKCPQCESQVNKEGVGCAKEGRQPSSMENSKGKAEGGPECEIFS